MTSRVDADLVAAEEAVHEAARAATGFDDFGDPVYLDGLRMVLRALHEDQGLEGEALVAAVVPGPVVTGLIGRLYAYHGFAEHPGYAQVEISDPLIVCGPPRTGTTALHQLLAEDPQFQGSESWLCHTPLPRPPRDRWAQYPEYVEHRARVEADRERLQALHWVAAEEFDETNVILRQTYSGNFSLRGPLPTYDAFALARDVTPAYRYIADVLRLIGLHEPDKPWLLKNPGDILSLDAILEVHPDARIVVTHRDPVSFIPSLASLLVALRSGTGRYGTDPGTIDAEAIARRELRQWRIGLERYEAAKTKHPDRFHDVWQRDLHRDPLGVAAGIYDRFGIELTPEVQTRMRAWAQRAGGGSLEGGGGHAYTLEQFGLTREEIEEAYAGYRERYGFA
jgi:hypothetical protein